MPNPFDMTSEQLSIIGTINQEREHEVNYELLTTAILVEEVIGFPPNSNPFHYDLYHMGCSISHSWQAMFSSAGEELGYLYLINTKNGRRFRLLLEDANIPKEESSELKFKVVHSSMVHNDIDKLGCIIENHIDDSTWLLRLMGLCDNSEIEKTHWHYRQSGCRIDREKIKAAFEKKSSL